MKKIIIAILIACFCIPAASLFGQPVDTNSRDRLNTNVYQTGRGVVSISQDPRLDELLNKHKLYNKEKNGMNGYRIQIYFDSGRTARESANETKAKFLSFFPDIEAHILYQSPFYKVRVGDFRTENEALKFSKKILRRFPQAYIVPDIIDFPELD